MKESNASKVTWRKRLWVAYFGFMFFWALNVYAFLGKLLVQGQQFAFRIDGKPYMSDFINVYGAGVLARDCLSSPVKIYDREVQDKLQRKLVAPVEPERTFYNQYPPLMFVVFIPLSIMSMTNAYVAWTLFSAVVAQLTLHFSVLKLFKSPFAKLTAASAFFGAYPVWLSFRLGQTSLFLFPVLVAFLMLLKQKRFVQAGVVASLVMLKLQYFPMVLAVGFAAGGLKFLASIIVSSLVLVGVCTLVVGWQNILAFPHAILSHEVSDKVVGVAAESMQNIRGMLVLVMGGDTNMVHYIAGACALLAVITMFFVWKRCSVKDPLRFDMLASITILVMLLTSPHTHTQDYMIAMLPCAWMFLIADRSELVNRKRGMFLKTLVISFTIVSWIFYLFMFLFHMLKIQPFAVWAIAMLAMSISMFRDRKPPAQTAEPVV